MIAGNASGMANNWPSISSPVRGSFEESTQSRPILGLLLLRFLILLIKDKCCARDGRSLFVPYNRLLR